jgi:hypothetical protein
MRYGFLSTHAPTACGLASFNAALAGSLTSGDDSGGIVRVAGRGERHRPSDEVTHVWAADETAGWRGAADALNTFDVAVIQHEYGIYPGQDGADVLRLMRRVDVPSIVVLHTVLSRPTPRQKSVLEQVAAVADAVVTMTGTAHDRLLIGYDVDPAKISVIPHGVTEHDAAPVARNARPHMLTVPAGRACWPCLLAVGGRLALAWQVACVSGRLAIE